MTGAARWRRVAWLVLGCVLLLGGCDRDEDEGGIIGTGIQLRGTVPTERMLASAEIGVQAVGGERSRGTIEANGRFSIDDLQGQAPYLLRVDLGNAAAYYAIAHAPESDDFRENVHAYSDLSARNWFASNGLDIDTAYAEDGRLDSLPSATAYAALTSRVQLLVQDSLLTYALGNVDLFSTSFEANDAGVDRFLDRNPVLIDDGLFTIIISEPNTGVRSTVSDAVPLITALTDDDNQAPSTPAGLRVLPSASNEIVVVWESATDNLGVSRYQVFRDGEQIATTPYPVYIDSNLPAAGQYSYEIAAVDVLGNVSERSAPGSSPTLGAPDVTAPAGTHGSCARGRSDECAPALAAEGDRRCCLPSGSCVVSMAPRRSRSGRSPRRSPPMPG